MEAVQNAANAASKMIFGESKTESGQEPVAGSQGQGTTTEPFDQGNKGAGAEGQSTSSSTENPTSTNVGSNQPASTATGDQPATSSTEIGSSQPASTSVGGAGSSDPTTGTGVTESQKPVQKQQGADKPLDEPTGQQQDAVKDTKDEGEQLLAKRDPNDHSGEPLKVHDGSEKKEESKEAEGDTQGEKSEGTGEQYVKSSGLAADGGDFDATKPGAGAEANRLLEQKGVHKDDKGRQQVDESVAGSGAGADDDKAKPKTMDKIKEKLHIGKH